MYMVTHNFLQFEIAANPQSSTYTLISLHSNKCISVLAIFFMKMTNTSTSFFKAAYSVTMKIFRNNYFLFKSFVKVELSYVFTIKMFSTAENCMEK